MIRLISKAYDKQVSAKGLALFRICYGILLAIFAIKVWYFLPLIADPIPYINTSVVDIRYGFVIWLPIIFLIIIGYQTRIAMVANYMCMVTMLSSLTTYQYHFDYASLNAGLFLIFIPCNQTYSVDSLIRKFKNPSQANKPVNTRQIYYYLILFFCLGVVYTYSMTNKLTSWMYMNGLGFWLPASIPQNAFMDLTPLLNIKYLMLFMGYMVLIYETSFIFFFYFKRLRVPYLIVGIGLHLGITLAYPIPGFGLICLIMLILLAPLKWWNCRPKFNYLRSLRVNIYFDENCIFCQKTTIFFKHFDFFRLLNFQGLQTALENGDEQLQKIGKEKLVHHIHSKSSNNKIAVGIETYRRILLRIWFLFPIGILLFLPGISHIASKIYNVIAKNRLKICNEDECIYTPPSTVSQHQHSNPLVRFLRIRGIIVFGILFLTVQTFLLVKDDYSVQLLFRKMGKEHVILGLRENGIADSFGRYVTKLTGMSAHGVFLYERHFKGYDHLVAITYKNEETGDETWLPLYQRNGLVSWYNLDRLWLKWNFRANSRNINQTELIDGIHRFTAFWARKHNIDLKHARFEIKVKVYDPITGWEKNYLKKQLAKEWKNGGYVQYDNYVFNYDNLMVIEDIR